MLSLKERKVVRLFTLWEYGTPTAARRIVGIGALGLRTDEALLYWGYRPSYDQLCSTYPQPT